MRAIVPAALLAALLAVAGCSGSNPAAPATGPATNVLVCKHYLAQYKWEQGLTFPTPADALKWEGYVGFDSGEATQGTKLYRDLAQELLDMQGKKNTYKNGTVYRDCLALQ